MLINKDKKSFSEIALLKNIVILNSIGAIWSNWFLKVVFLITIEEENSSLLEIFRYTKSATVTHYEDIYEVFSESMNRINQKHCVYNYKNGNSLLWILFQPKIPTNYTQVYDEISTNKQFISDILQKWAII